MHIVVGPVPGGTILTPLDDDGGVLPTGVLSLDELPAEVARREAEHPRWVWGDTARWYPRLLQAGVRVERCVDLRLCHAILRNSQLTTESELARSRSGPWDGAAAAEPRADGVLFDLVESREPQAEPDPVAEFQSQQAAVAACSDPGRISRLLAAESAGALVAAEMTFAGMPWRADVHDAVLTELLGQRPEAGERPAKLEALLHRMRDLLDVPDLNPDSPAELLKGLGVAGLIAKSTRSWELERLKHPAIEPLLEYKKLSRLMSANGWNWLDSWVHDGRFKPEYVPGGVVTGRWATSGGGALQIPKQVRAAAVADPGWKLVVADAAQLEPRILAAMSTDRAMVDASTAGDMYAAIVASGAVDTREHAKVALLAAMYGATTGEAGRLMPRLARAYPRAIAMVEDAARAGERGEVVSTRLGRSSPRPSAEWQRAQSEAYAEGATDAARSRARGEARSWGRFTRNFIVQGTAAEWALCWMASLRRRLGSLTDGPWLEGPHLVFFLHDEIVVHSPEPVVDLVAEAVRGAAREAGTLLFGELPVEFPLAVAVVDSYGDAK